MYALKCCMFHKTWKWAIEKNSYFYHLLRSSKFRFRFRRNPKFTDFFIFKFSLNPFMFGWHYIIIVCESKLVHLSCIFHSFELKKDYFNPTQFALMSVRWKVTKSSKGRHGSEDPHRCCWNILQCNLFLSYENFLCSLIG